MLEINQIIIFKEPFFKEYLTYFQPTITLHYLENCSKLESVDLWYSNIDSADTLLKLKNVNRLILTGTPLAQNEKEIAKLKKAFPEAKIIVD